MSDATIDIENLPNLFNPSYFYNTSNVTYDYLESNFFRKNGGYISGYTLFNDSVQINGNLNVNNSFTIDGNPIDISDISYISGITPGTVTASKALVVDANKDIG